MPIIVDTSIAACWCLPDEYSDAANEALNRIKQGGMTVPALFRYELENVLLVNERRKRISASQASEGMTLISRLPSTVDMEFDRTHLVQVAQRHSLSIYDAAYLELAFRYDLPLATLDKRLAKAANAEGLSVVTDA